MVPHEKGLAGHSDADVGIHALCDAIYGALAEGDIGRHFPPSEATWKDADSARFLIHAAERIAARGGRLANADVTLDLRAAKDHAARAGDDRPPRLAARRRSRTRFGEGHDHRKTGLYRSRRGHRRPGRGIHPCPRMTHIAGDRETMRKFTTLAAVLAVSLMAGCAQSQAPDENPYPPVPPLVSETIPKPPVTAEALMWQPGHWDWNGTRLCLGKGAICAGGWPRQPVDAWMVVAHPERLDLDAAALAVLIR